MKNILMCFLALAIIFTFSACSNLNQKEKVVTGTWSQNLAVANLYFDMKTDKTFEAYAQSNLLKSVIICWKGSWKVEGDELQTDISEGPTLVTGLVEAKIGNLLEKFGLENDKIAFRAKIIETTDDEIILSMLKRAKNKMDKSSRRRDQTPKRETNRSEIILLRTL